MTTVKEIEMGNMGRLREASQQISQHLQKRLSGYLSTLSPLFAPRKVLGEFMQSAFTDKVPGADNRFVELEESFKTICRDGFDLSAKLTTPVPNIKNQLEIENWQYRYQVGGEGGRTATITSPVRWVLSYGGGYTLSDLMEQRAQGQEPSGDEVKSLVLRSLTMAKLVEISPAVSELMRDLRFPVAVEASVDAGNVPGVVIAAQLPTFRPQDELIETVIQLSGMPVFEELVDLEGIAGLNDPFKDEVLALVG